MWLAQCTKHMTKSHDQRYYLKYSMRDMGVLDFYMGQLIMAVLYARFAIPYDMTFLWHTTLCTLAFWAAQNNLLRYNNNNIAEKQYLLWRWVMGDADNPATPMSSYQELAFSGRLTTPSEGSIVYYFWVWSDDMPAHLKSKFTIWVNTWIVPLGCALMDMNCPVNCDAGNYNNLRAFVQLRTNRIFYRQLKNVCGHVENGSTTVDKFINNPSIDTLRRAMRSIFPQTYNRIMWENFATLAVARCRFWYMRLPDNIRLNADVTNLWTRFMQAVVAMVGV